ncbi:MAG: serine/threonine protein kinase [Polyangiaceae bacterium]|nr:serine/threonine protein kinase [Polyangiaceae bacterium]
MKHLLTALLFGLSVMGCQRFEAKTPAEFVELESPGYDYRAASADGVVLAARSLENRPKGTLSFYVDVTKRKLRERDGYTLVDEREAVARSGQRGATLRFGRDHGGAPHSYQVTLFVTDDRIFVLEAGGAKPDVEAHATEIDASIASFVIK